MPSVPLCASRSLTPFLLSQAFLESYMELSPDGEYIETEQAPEISEAYLGAHQRPLQHSAFPLLLRCDSLRGEKPSPE